MIDLTKLLKVTFDELVEDALSCIDCPEDYELQYKIKRVRQIIDILLMLKIEWKLKDIMDKENRG